MEVIEPESDDVDIKIKPYDIVDLTSSKDDIDGELAYVIRVPSSLDSGQIYTLWYPGNSSELEDGTSSRPRLIEYREGSLDGIVTSISIRQRSPHKSITSAVKADTGRYLVGIPNSNFEEKHVLRVIRTDHNSIFVVRDGDLAEQVIRIPVGPDGLGKTTPYVFLIPAESRSPDEAEIPVTATNKERDDEIRRLEISKHVNVLRTDLPEYIIREETIRSGGTKDSERLRGQISAAVGAIGKGTISQFSAASERIKDLILKETQQDIGKRTDLFDKSTPSLLRDPTSQNTFPTWVIPIDSSRKGERSINELKLLKKKSTDESHADITLPKFIPIGDDVKKMLIQDNIRSLREPLALDSGKGLSIHKRTPYYLASGATVISYKTSETVTYPGGENAVTRIALPEHRILLGNNDNDSQVVIPHDKITLDGAVVIPITGYSPKGTPLVQVDRRWTPSIHDTSKLQVAPILSGSLNSDSVSRIMRSPILLDASVSTTPDQIREILSPLLIHIINSIRTTFKKHIIGGYDELLQILLTFGYSRHNMTNNEFKMLSAIINHNYEHITKLRNTITDGTNTLRLPRPDALFKDAISIKKAYPETFGLIGPWEAYHRITNAPRDHGALLYTLRAMNEYKGLRDTMEKAVKESSGRRAEIRRNMSDITERLKEINGQLSTLKNIAKHYESKKEIDSDNRDAKPSEGKPPKVILWDESLDDDKYNFLYNGERLQKIIGSLLIRLQDEKRLPIGELSNIQTSADTSKQTPEEDVVTERISEAEASGMPNTISPRLLRDAVYEDLDIFIASLPVEEKTHFTDDRRAELVRRIILGGRPVADGDIALITRHLRTAAYSWDDRQKKWRPVKDSSLKIQQGDVVIHDLPARTQTIYSKTLALNQEYRKLSKMKDDMELAEARPSASKNPEEMTRALDILFERGKKFYNTRRGLVQNNRILDESPFIHDTLNVMLRRMVVNESNTTKSDADIDADRRIAVTIHDLRKAKLDDTLIIDTEQALFEAGIGNTYDNEDKPIPALTSDILLPPKETDPRLCEVIRRDSIGSDAKSFLAEVEGKDAKARRAIYLGVGLTEMTLKTPLTNEEVTVLVTEGEHIAKYMRGNLPESIITGVIFGMLLIMTRIDSKLSLPSTEGIIPPPQLDTVPSYFYPPAKFGDDERMIYFILNILKKISIKVTDIERTRTYTPEEYISMSKLIQTKQEAKQADIINVIATRLTRGTPGIIDRIFKAQRQLNKPKTYGSTMESYVLRKVGHWETIPIGFHPSPNGKLMKEGIRLLRDETPLYTDSFGNPIRNNASLPSSISKLTIKDVLSAMDRERSDTMKSLLFESMAHDEHSMTYGKSLTHTPAYDKIGVRRPKSKQPPLTREEKLITINNIQSARINDITEFDMIKDDDALSESDLSRNITEMMDEYFKNTNLRRIFDTDYITATNVFLSYGNGKATRESNDANGSLRAELIAVHDALAMAIQEHLYNLEGIEQYKLEPTDGGFNGDEIEHPIYGIHNRVKELFKNITPSQIESGKGGGRLPVIVGKHTYYEKVIELRNMLPTQLGINTTERAIIFRRLIRDIHVTILSIPERVPRKVVLYQIMKKLYDTYFDGEKTEDEYAAIDAYISLYAHRYSSSKTRGRRKYEKYGILTSIIELASNYTNVSPSMIIEEANKDKIMERQRFTYQLEGLDAEHRKITRALRLLGLDLAGKVSRDPKKFNAEYYKQQSALVAEQEMKNSQLSNEIRSQQFGDAIDSEMMAIADAEAPDEVNQVEGIDYDE